MQWKFKTQQAPTTTAELKQILLKNRDLKDDADFFRPPPPKQLTLSQVGLDKDQVATAVDRIKKAIEAEEEMVIFGDYDADGVCATAILWQVIYDLGGQVKPFIPHRERHGYGLSEAALKELLEENDPALVITVDNGIVAHQPAQILQEKGLDLIITDHHQPENELPAATAIVQTDQLCGATVAWMLAQELDKKLAHKMLDLTAIATVADQVPLRKANRVFAYHGLKALRQTKRPGIKALLKQANYQQVELSAQSIGYGLAPRINAMGRLKHSLDALRLLLTTNQKRAQQLALKLGQTNSKRQDLTYEMYGQALSQAKSWENEHLIVVHSTEYHEGVVGLIAGRLVEKFHKPAVVLSVGEKQAKASARSVPGVNIVQLLRQMKDDLLEVGGHPMAAGFCLETDKLEATMKKLQKMARAEIEPELLQPSLEIETVLPFSLLSEETVEVVQNFAPFGQANQEPVFVLEEVEVVEVKQIGSDQKHLKIVGRVDQTNSLDFLYWRHGQLAEKIKPQDKIKIAGVLEINEWNGRRSVQVRVEDLQ